MAVYVDPLTNYGGSATFKWKWSCHMYADTLAELHAMAKRIGLRREWFQDQTRLPHYDLNYTRREAALRAGALDASYKHLRKFMLRIRERELANAEQRHSP